MEFSVLDSAESTLVDSPGKADDLFLQFLRSPSPDSESILDYSPNEEEKASNVLDLNPCSNKLNAEKEFSNCEGSNTASKTLIKNPYTSPGQAGPVSLILYAMTCPALSCTQEAATLSIDKDHLKRTKEFLTC